MGRGEFWQLHGRTIQGWALGKLAFSLLSRGRCQKCVRFGPRGASQVWESLPGSCSHWRAAFMLTSQGRLKVNLTRRLSMSPSVGSSRQTETSTVSRSAPSTMLRAS